MKARLILELRLRSLRAAVVQPIRRARPVPRSASLTAGAHTITADYLGDATFNASANSLSQQVNQSNTTMTVSSAPVSPTFVSQSVTFSVKIVRRTSGTVPGPPQAR